MCDFTEVKSLTDIIHGTIIYSGIENEILKTPIFNRLHRISQSSLVFQTFSSNRVKRFEHSIGTMHLAGKIFFNGISNSSKENIKYFMDEIFKEIELWRDNYPHQSLSRELNNTTYEKIICNAVYPQSSFYYSAIPANIETKNVYCYLVIYQAIRIAGLLHDVGHLPYSHILEKALKKLYNKVNDSRNIKNNYRDMFISTMKDFVENKDEIHEEFGKLLVLNIKTSIDNGLTLSQKNDMIYFFFLISFEFANKILCSNYNNDNNIFSDLHLIISGVVDADRLDYCSRDSFCAALNKDILNYDRFVQGYTMIYREVESNDKHFLFAPATKNISLIEELLRKRYRIYSDINYHHKVHKHEIILENVICEIGLMELEMMSHQESAEYLVGKELPPILPLEVNSIWLLVKEIKQNSRSLEYQLIQLDDGWLDTLLKHKFFQIYSDYSSIKKNGDQVLWNQFDELISTRKHYFSLIKRSNDFQRIDESFFKTFMKSKWENREINEKLEKIYNMCYTEFLKEYHSFFFNKIVTWFAKTLDKDTFYQSVEKDFNEALQENPNSHILHCIIRSSRFGNGLNTVNSPVCLVDKTGKGTMLEQLSFQRNVFLSEEKLTPPFHFYYLPEYSEDYVTQIEINIDDLIDKLIRVLIECLKTYDQKMGNVKR